MALKDRANRFRTHVVALEVIFWLGAAFNAVAVGQQEPDLRLTVLASATRRFKDDANVKFAPCQDASPARHLPDHTEPAKVDANLLGVCWSTVSRPAEKIGACSKMLELIRAVSKFEKSPRQTVMRRHWH